MNNQVAFRRHKTRKSFVAKRTKNFSKVYERMSLDLASFFKSKFRFMKYLSHDSLMSVSEPAMFSPWEWSAVSQYQAFFKKNVSLIEDESRTADAALSKFLECEELCARTNDSFREWNFSNADIAFIGDVRHFCQMILSVNPCFRDLDFGPGSTFSIKGSEANIIRKLKDLPDVTVHCHDLAIQNILEYAPSYAISCGLVNRERGGVNLAYRHLPITKGNRFLTVPKNNEVDRPICVEPSGNMLLQKALGSQLRKLFNRYSGFDLNFVPEIHKGLVKSASVDGNYATIDLSNASDTVSYELVKYLLPAPWFDALNACRSRNTLLPNGSWIRCEKFSSMGNGFTFELETIIFYCFCLAYRRRFGNKGDFVSCFGDDIIVPSYYTSLPRFLETFGFRCNAKKTFFDGPFRESCGADYHTGYNVRPVYIRGARTSDIEDTYLLARRLFEIEEAFALSFPYRLKVKLINFLPLELRTFGPLPWQLPWGHDSIVHKDFQDRKSVV